MTDRRKLSLQRDAKSAKRESFGSTWAFPDHRVDEWLGVEKGFGKSMKLFEEYGGMSQNGLGHDYNHSYWP